MVNQHPEQKARDVIDAKLIEAGWLIQDKSNMNPHAALGVAIKEYPTDVGPADYALFVEGTAVGIIEAKPEAWGQKLTTAEDQTEGYANAPLKWINNKQPLPFLYQSNSVIIHFTDSRDPKPRAREIFNFYRPETLQQEFDKGTSLRQRLQTIPPLNPYQLPVQELGLRDCQEKAIINLEESFKYARPRALIQMATGAGKTYTAITAMYRLIKFAGAKRILFLVDTKNLGEQAEQEMLAYNPIDDNRKFTELYPVQLLKSSHIASSSKVCISTMQRMYAILKGEELPEELEETNPAEQLHIKEPPPVVYNPKLPLEYFDFIFIDECHRSIYNLWRQVLEYFDAFLIGLTATPDNRTFGFFNQNIVSEYGHEQAVADGVNVGNDVYLIDTHIGTHGSTLKAEQLIEHREKQTRKKRWQQQDQDEDYRASQLDRDVVNPDHIRTVIDTFKQEWPNIFVGRKEVPKTLIFAKNDSHADDIIQKVREIFDEENSFCKKITCKAAKDRKDSDGNILEKGEDPKNALSQFRNNYHPRIAVTVDMIATGTDVKPLECLIFMRDVKSRNYFEQMKGRGTRTLALDELRKVTPSAVLEKDRYVIIDAVGVTKTIKTESSQLDVKKSLPLEDLARGVMMGGVTDTDAVSSLAGRLARLNKHLDPKDQQNILKKSGGISLTQIIHGLFDAIDADNVNNLARQQAGLAIDEDPTPAQQQTAQASLVKEVAKHLNGELIELLVTIRQEKEQKIDHDNLDTVTYRGWDANDQQNNQQLIQEFSDYLASQKDQVTALQIFYNQPYRRKELTYQTISELYETLKTNKPNLAPSRIWRAYTQLDNYQGEHPVHELTVMVSLIRRVCGLDNSLTNYESVVRRNFQKWILAYHKGAGEKFTEEQMWWLRKIRDHIANSFHLEKDDLEMAPFDSKGGLGKMYQLFNGKMDSLIDELNEVLVA